MDSSRHIRIFDQIAPVYRLFFSWQTRIYRRLTGQNRACFPDPPGTILDIGCGTGALACVLSGQGHLVVGVDGASAMIRHARQLCSGHAIQFVQADALRLDQSLVQIRQKDSKIPERFDVVVAGYVLHGLDATQRACLYSQMKKHARHRVIIMDYNQRRGLITSMVEWLEHGDYFNFIQVIHQEMVEHFPSVRIIETGKRAAWYICECREHVV